MNHQQFRGLWIVAAVLVTASAYGAAAVKTVSEHRAVDAAAQVELIDTAGRIEVQGWDKPELEVSGTLGAEAERLEITQNGVRSTVRVVGKGIAGIHFGWGDAVATHLVVKMPKGGSLKAQVTSTDLRIQGLLGNQELQTVSGDITTAAAAETRIRTVSGDLHLDAAPTARLTQLSTVSGDATVTGGAGEFSFQSVSGDAHLKMGLLNRVNLKSVSGDLDATLGLSGDGRLEAETVSGDVQVSFAGALPPADYEVSSLSGDLSTCQGRKATQEGYGPGSRLVFREGAATARVRIDTKSGDVTLCSR